MKILHLTLKRKWYDMIESGIKREEYREIKPYWEIRLAHKKFDAVCFQNGYSKDARRMTWEVDCIVQSLGYPEWGAPEKQKVFVISLGKEFQTRKAIA